jgi:tRNA threonylcarbamoyladenosine biosynthesis protein TsaE
VKLLSKNTRETQRIAADLAHSIITKKSTPRAKVVALYGELGAGKTTFVQGFARALGIRRTIKSPTFLIMREYPITSGSLFHLDCYRIHGIKDIASLDIRHIFTNRENIVLIEWAERIGKILPRDTVTVHFEHAGATQRMITISP